MIEGENPTSFFCKLEKRQFVEKTTKKLETCGGQILQDQKEITDYYTNLFQDNKLEKVDLTVLLKDAMISKINEVDLGKLLMTK